MSGLCRPGMYRARQTVAVSTETGATAWPQVPHETGTPMGDADIPTSPLVPRKVSLVIRRRALTGHFIKKKKKNEALGPQELPARPRGTRGPLI